MDIHLRPLPYADSLQRRGPDTIDLLVIHCTELPDLSTARNYGETVHYPESGTGNSGHYYIDRDGRCEQWVDDNRVAHHVRGLNAHSIGVELVNRGRWPDWFHAAHQQPEEAYPGVQIGALIDLIAVLRRRLPKLEKMAGHAQLDLQQIPSADDPDVLVQRKIDPGPLFPWSVVLDASKLRRWKPPE